MAVSSTAQTWLESMEESEVGYFKRLLTDRHKKTLMDSIYVTSMYYTHVRGWPSDLFRATNFPTIARPNERLERSDFDAFFFDEDNSYLLLGLRYAEMIDDPMVSSNNDELFNLYLQHLPDDEREFLEGADEENPLELRRRVDDIRKTFVLRAFLYRQRREATQRAAYFGDLFERVRTYMNSLGESEGADMYPHEKLTVSLLLMAESGSELRDIFMSPLYYPAHERLVHGKVFGDTYNTESPLFTWWFDLGTLMHANRNMKRIILPVLGKQLEVQYKFLRYLSDIDDPAYYTMYRFASYADRSLRANNGIGLALMYGSSVQQLHFRHSLALIHSIRYVVYVSHAWNLDWMGLNIPHAPIMLPRLTNLTMNDSQWNEPDESDAETLVCLFSAFVERCPNLETLNHAFQWMRHKVYESLIRAHGRYVALEYSFREYELRRWIYDFLGEIGEHTESNLYALPYAELVFEHGRYNLTQAIRRWASPKAVKLRLLFGLTDTVNEAFEPMQGREDAFDEERDDRVCDLNEDFAVLSRQRTLQKVLAAYADSLAYKPTLQHFEALLGILTSKTARRDDLLNKYWTDTHAEAFNSVFITARLPENAQGDRNGDDREKYIGLREVIANPELTFFKVQLVVDDARATHISEHYLEKVRRKEVEIANIRKEVNDSEIIKKYSQFYRERLDKTEKFWEELTDEQASSEQRACEYVRERFGEYAEEMMRAVYRNARLEVCVMDVIIISSNIFFSPPTHGHGRTLVGKQLPTIKLLNDAFEKVIRYRRRRGSVSAPQHLHPSSASSSVMGTGTGSLSNLARQAYHASRGPESASGVMLRPEMTLRRH